MNKTENISLLSRHMNKTSLFVFLNTGIIRSIVTFLLSVSIGEFYQLCFHAGGSRAMLLARIDIHLENIESFFILFASLVLVKMILDYAENYLMNKASENFVQELRDKIFKTQIEWPNEYFGRRHFGKYLLRYSNDMKAVQNYLSRGIYGGCRDVLFLMVGVTILYLIHIQLATMYIVLMAASVIIIFYASSRQIPLIENSRNKRNRLLAFVTKSFQRHTRIKTAEIEERTISRFDNYSQELKVLNLKNHKFDSLLLVLFTFLQYCIIIFLLFKIYQLHQDANSKLDIGSALVFLLVVLQINPTLKRIMKVPSILNKGKISLKKIERIRPIIASAALPDNLSQ